MKKIAVFISVGVISLFLSFSAYTMALCKSTEYNIFLVGQGETAPADLINESAYETQTQKFNISLDLVNVTPDVLQARIELYRYLDEDAPNEGWKLEQSLFFNPPFFPSVTVPFEDLKKGKTYAITLIVTTDMPNISVGDGSLPVDITTKTLYILWPKEHGMYLSASNSFEGDPRTEHFKVKWSSAAGSAKTRIKAHHADNTDNPVVDSTPDGEIIFSDEEVWAWPSDNLASLSVDALDSSGNVLATTNLTIGPTPPCADCSALPCQRPSLPPNDPDLWVGPANRILDDDTVRAIVSYKYGGAFLTLRLKSYVDPNNNKMPFELINNVGGDDGYGIDGVLCQTAVTRKNDKWDQYDDSFPTMQSENVGNCISWENDPCGQYAPECMDDYDNTKDKFHWNPNQGGPQAGSDLSCNVIPDNQDIWNGKFLFNHLGQNICMPPIVPPSTAIPPVCAYSKTVAPYYTNPAAGMKSPVHYRTLFKHWLPLGTLPTSPNFQGQPQVAMSSTAQFVANAGTGSSGIKIKSRYVLHCNCFGQPNCHCADASYAGPAPGQLAWDFGAAIQDWIFFGSVQVKHAYYFDPSNTDNCYGMLEDTHLCKYGDNECLSSKGWKFYPPPLNPNWVPYTLLSTTPVNGQEAWILIYNPGESSSDTPKKGELRRIWQTSDDYKKGVTGYVAAPITRLDSLSDTWSDESETVIFVGPTMDSVMYHLQNYTNGRWPRITTTYSIRGNVTYNSVSLSGVTVSTGTVSATTDANGNYLISGLKNGTYTITPSKTGYAFSPAYYSVTVSDADVTGKDFTATATASYSISGTVSGATNSGVTMTLTGAANATTITASNGTYTFSGLGNGSYTVTPSKSGYTFSPTNLSVTISGANQTGKNFTATAAPTYTISGVITLGGAGLSGVTVTAGSSTAVTASNGTYTIYGMVNGTYTVNPSKTGYTFSPVNYSVTISGANVTGKNFTATSAPGIYTTSGRILFKKMGLANYNVLLSGTSTETAKTDSQGYYEFTGLSNGPYHVEPDISSTYQFTPSFYDLTVSGQNIIDADFIASPILLRGVVITSQGNGIAGIKMKTGDKTTTTDETGEFIFADLPPGDYTLAPSEEDAAKYVFDPPNRKIKIKENDNCHKEQDFRATPK